MASTAPARPASARRPFPACPDYTLDGLLTWTHGNFSLTGHGHYIPHGIYW
jgi:hypothetical protein